MSFTDIKDQTVPTRLLRNCIQSGRLPNGLLFWGPDGVGKRFAAMEMAKAINCSDGDADACDACLSCRKVAGGNHPDVKIVTPAGKTRIINIEAVEMINEMTMYRPFEAEWRVVIIEDVDRMQERSQNYFLKTLEEPPSKTIFILLTQAPGRLLPTIKSRCQQVRFGALQAATVSGLLQRDHELGIDAADAIAALSQGQMARALDLVTTEKREIVLDVTRRLEAGEDPLALSEEFVHHLEGQMESVAADLKASLKDQAHEDLSKDDKEAAEEELKALTESLTRKEVMEYLRLLQSWYRDVAVYQTTHDPARVLNRDQLDRLKNAAPGDLAAKVEAIEQAWWYLERNLRRDRICRDLFFTLAEQ